VEPVMSMTVWALTVEAAANVAAAKSKE